MPEAAMPQKMQYLLCHSFRKKHRHMTGVHKKMIGHVLQASFKRGDGTVVGLCKIPHQPADTDRKGTGNGAEITTAEPGIKIAGKRHQAAAEKCAKQPTTTQAIGNITARVRSAEGDDTSRSLLRKIMKQTPHHQSAKTVGDKMHCLSRYLLQEGIESRRVLSQVACHAAITELINPVAGLP